MQAMKTVTMPKADSMTITLGPIVQRLHFCGKGRKRFADNKRRPHRAARKRQWKGE